SDWRSTDRAGEDIVGAQQKLVIPLASVELGLRRLVNRRSSCFRWRDHWCGLASREGEDLARGRLSNGVSLDARGNHRHADLAAEVVVEGGAPDDVRIGVDQ